MRICGGSIEELKPQEYRELVAIGVALIDNETYVIKEPLVKQFLRVGQSAFRLTDRHIALRCASTTGTGFGECAEWAIVNQVLTYHQYTLLSMLEYWGCVVKERSLFNEVRLLAEYAASVESLVQRPEKAYYAYVEPHIPRITRPRTGLRIPDCFGGLEQRGELVGAWAAQIKAEKQRLSPEEFADAVHSTSTYHSLADTTMHLSVLTRHRQVFQPRFKSSGKISQCVAEDAAQQIPKQITIPLYTCDYMLGWVHWVSDFGS
jgi:hypothetical protein